MNTRGDFYTVLNSIEPLTEDAWTDLEFLLEEKTLSKGDYIAREGNRVHSACFLAEGIVRVFYSKEGSEYNKTFFIPGTFPTPLTALLSQSPSQLSFEALTKCTVLFFSFKKFEELFVKHRCIESLMRKILEMEWIKKERHDIRMVVNDATANYLIFQQEFPGVEQQIPQYHIASYLGITPIQLSRIRAKLAQAK